MSNLLKIDFGNLRLPARQKGSSVLGLTLDGGKLEGVVLRRTNGSVQLQQSFSATLSLDPLTNDPELVGREIRNHLDAAGIRERRCVMGLPLKWALTTHTALPKLPEAEIAGLLQIEAERGFPCDVSTLLHGASRYASSSGDQYATFVGVPRSQVALVEQAIRAAQLRPVSFSLGLLALQPPAGDPARGVLALAIGETHVGLEVTCGGGVAALRALEGALEAEAGQRHLHADVVAREVRITLGQLPSALRETVRHVRIFGPRDLAQQLADEIELRLESMQLEVELVSGYGPEDFQVQVPRETTVSPAFSLATRLLTGDTSPFEFLPPHVSAWQQFAARYSSGKMQQAGIAAGAIAALIIGAFLLQQWQIWSAQSQWDTIKTKATELKDLQAKTAQFLPWFDTSLREMNILRRLTEAFPEDGSVTAKTIEIRDLNSVTCTGTARDYQALLEAVRKLRAVPQIPAVSMGPTRGKSPNMQFTFNFVWSEGGSSAN